ncbi:MAG: transposase [Candidatus Aerophobetes bacterium]|nr:transposase [Candidatus Aerophobetes bacterium]
MRKQRRFTAEFKREVVEELLSGATGPAQLSRRYNLSSGLLYHWKRQYARGKFDNEPVQGAAMLDRINKLEQMLGKLTLENEFLKKALRNSLKEQERKENSLPLITPLSEVSKGGAN